MFCPVHFINAGERLFTLFLLMILLGLDGLEVIAVGGCGRNKSATQQGDGPPVESLVVIDWIEVPRKKPIFALLMNRNKLFKQEKSHAL